MLSHAEEDKMRPARLVLVVTTVAALALVGVRSLPIKYLLNTHHHTDHAGGDATFVKTTELIAHRNVRENFLRNKQPGAPRITFNDQAAVSLGNVEVRAYYFGRGIPTATP